MQSCCLLHVPIWLVRYDHKGDKIILVVLGNSGNVINSMGLCEPISTLANGLVVYGAAAGI